jgi:hypothetical protein
MLDTLVHAAQRLPSSQCDLMVAQVGGQMNRVPADAMAFARRDVAFVVNVHTRWRDPAQDAECIAWARRLFDALVPEAMGSVYVNFIPDDETDRIRSAFGPNYVRLAEAKRRYDPQNLFRLNENIAVAN